MRNKISKKRIKKMIDSGFSGLSTAEIQKLIQAETEKEESEIDTDYIDLCFELLALNQNDKSAKAVRYRKSLRALIAAAVAAVFLACVLTVSAQVFRFNIPQEIAKFLNGNAEVDINLENADTTADGYALTETTFAKELEALGISPITFPEELLGENCEILKIEEWATDKTIASVVLIDFIYQGNEGDLLITQYAKEFEWNGEHIVEGIEAAQLIKANGLDILILENGKNKSLIIYKDDMIVYEISVKADLETAIEFAKTIK